MKNLKNQQLGLTYKKLTNNNDIKEEIKLLIEITEEFIRFKFENKLYRDSIARAYYAIFHSAKAR